MKVGILAGGLGTRLAEETDIRPKPMVEVGGRPVLWHLLQYYRHFGHREFVVALGYKGDFVKRWFTDMVELSGDLGVDFAAARLDRRPADLPDWHLELIDTGAETGTGGRIRRLAPYLGGETCMVTWGDGLADVDLDDLLRFHRRHGRLCTVTAVRPPARFGSLDLDGDAVRSFVEKPATGEGWINGAFFVIEPGVFEYIDGDSTMFEREPLEHLARDGQLMAYRHSGFWQCMDTVQDKRRLESLWESGAPWKVW